MGTKVTWGLMALFLKKHLGSGAGTPYPLHHLGEDVTPGLVLAGVQYPSKPRLDHKLSAIPTPL